MVNKNGLDDVTSALQRPMLKF